MTVTADILRAADGYLLLRPKTDVVPILKQLQPETVEVVIEDGRTITRSQQKKIFAILRDIALWSGNEVEYLRYYLQIDFCKTLEIEPFSLSDCSIETASRFIDYLIDFCFRWNVATATSMLNQCDDIDRYLYICLKERKCAICNAPAQVHHVERVGAGRNREHINHVGMLAIALCAKHHEMAHMDEQTLFEKYHIYGIPLTPHLCDVLGLHAEEVT